MRTTIITAAIHVFLISCLVACQRDSAQTPPAPEIDGLRDPSTATPTSATGRLLITPARPASTIAILLTTPRAKENAPIPDVPIATPVPFTPTPLHLQSLASLIPPVTPFIAPMPLPTPGDLTDVYIVRPGDTLSGISWAFGAPLEDILSLNGFESEAVIIKIGQAIRVPLQVSRVGPSQPLLPDSEVVYSPAYVNFSTTAFVAQQGGYLSTYIEQVDGVLMSGAEIVDLVARRYSVGPRVLLAALEFYGGWVTQPRLQSYTPVGPANLYGGGSGTNQPLYLPLSWLANRINEGYYAYKQKGQTSLRFRDGSRALVPPSLNAGTVGLQNLLAVNTDWETWLTQLSPAGFRQSYRRLFGDPFALALEPLIPHTLTQPTLRLPWLPGQIFYYTGGPHGAYGEGSAGTAIDFGPPDILGSCFYSQVPVTAAADGQVFLGDIGEIYLDLDRDGQLQTGWVLLYLHIVAVDELQQGQTVSVGTPLGYASCEGGLANASHLHFARRYNGEWILASGPVPLVLSGWRVMAGAGPYEGQLVRGDVIKEAGEFWDEALNGLVGE